MLETGKRYRKKWVVLCLEETFVWAHRQSNIEGMVWDENWRGRLVVLILHHLHAFNLRLWTLGFCVKADKHETPPTVEGSGGGDRQGGVGLDLGGMECVRSSGRSWCTLTPAGQCLPCSRTESANQAPELVSPAAPLCAFTWLCYHRAPTPHSPGLDSKDTWHVGCREEKAGMGCSRAPGSRAVTVKPLSFFSVDSIWNAPVLSLLFLT